MAITRAVVSEMRNGKFVVAVLVRIGCDTWRDSRNYKPVTFTNKERAIEYGKTFGEVVA